MVRLSRIYTKTGDRGRTSLGDGTRVAKSHVRIAAYGAVDELNSVLGMVVQEPELSQDDRALLRRIQNDLFDVGADLCVPLPASEKKGERLRVVQEQVQALEEAIDLRNQNLQPLTSFVLPGGRPAAAWLHVARAVCRRAELGVVRLLASGPKKAGSQVLPYLNRLSDLLFVMARCANDAGQSDVLWEPGAGRSRAPRRSQPDVSTGKRKGSTASRQSAGRRTKKST